MVYRLTESSDLQSFRLWVLTHVYTLRPLLPPGFLVVSCGTGVTSSILPIRNPDLASALIAAWAPGPGILGPTPPTARTRICKALMPFALAVSAAATADFMAAYGED